MGTRGGWSHDLLGVLGNASPDDRMTNFVAAWTKAESTNARFNPLATTLRFGESSSFNSSGVQNFANRLDGLTATALTLTSGGSYTKLTSALRTNDGEGALRALSTSPWGTDGFAVETIWRRGDVRNETLLSEEPQPEPLSSEGVKPITSDVHAPSAEKLAQAAKVTVGVALIGVGVLLVLKGR